jgi:hypothetical protein
MQLARTRAFTSSKQARNVQCRAVKVDSSASSRRQALAGLSLTTGLALLPNKAWALIPDEEDEELLLKAKANRQKRLQAQKEVTREFLREDGLKDKLLDSELVPVQKAVFQLAKSGSQLESGDLKAASATLSSGWVDDFKRATAVLDANDTEQARAAAIFDNISSLQDATKRGDVKVSKKTFVAVVSAVQDWANSTGLAANLKGL